MSDAAAGTGAGAGAGAGAGTGTGAGTGAPAAPWHGIAATDTAGVEYVTNKGWQNPGDVIKSYQGAEKLIGRDPNTLITIPRADDPAGFMAAMDKLGRPADPSKYEFAKPEGMTVDAKYQDWARGTFHKLGLPAQVVKSLSAEHNAYIKSVVAEQDKQYELSLTADKATLQNEWKDGTDRMLGLAKATAQGLGFPVEVIDAAERTLGYAKTMKLFAEIGKRLGEDNFVTGGGEKTRGLTTLMTPQEAKSDWDASKLDSNFMKALNDKSHPGHEAAQKKQTDLFKIMYPNG